MTTSRARHYKSLLDRLCGQPLLSDELIQAAVDSVARSMGIEVATLYAYDRRAGVLVLVGTHGLNRTAVGYVTLKPGQGVSGRAFATGQPFFLADVREDPSFFTIPSFDHARYLSILAVPVVLNGEPIGALNVQSLATHQYQPRETQELTEIAELTAPMLDQLWRGDLAARIRGSSALSRMDGLLSGRFGRDTIARRLAEQLHSLFPARQATVALPGANGPAEFFGDPPADATRSMLESEASRLAESTQPEMDAAGAILVRLRAGNQPVGAFYLSPGEATRGPLSSAAARLLGELGAQVANGLQAAAAGAPADGAPVADPRSVLVQLVLDGAGLDALLERAFELCGAPLAVTDLSGTLVAGAIPNATGINVPLSVDSVVVGRLLAPGDADPAIVAGPVAQAAALELAKWKLRFDIERELRGDALESLLAVEGDAREWNARAHLVGIDPSARYVPVLFAFDVDGLAATHGSLVLRSMLATIQRTFGAAPASLSFARPDGVLVFVDETAVPRGALVPVAHALGALRLTATGVTVGAGMGPATDPAAFSRAIREARLAADLALRLEAPEPIDSTRLGAYRLFVGMESRERLQEFVDRYIGVLVQHDAQHATQFVRTLEAFHAHNENPRPAAAALFMHANTLKYRLSRVEVLTGLDLHRASDRFNAYLALYALHFLEPDRHSMLPTDFANAV